MYKAPGPDEIPSRFLKEYADTIAPILTKIFQRSLNLGVITEEWKKAKVTPFFEKGNRNDPCNYTPISLTCIACKILEHIVCSTIADHLETFNTLREVQHGFRNHRSCESQRLLCIDDIVNSLVEGEQVVIILSDFQKAFDKVPYKRLIHKFKHYVMELGVN